MALMIMFLGFLFLASIPEARQESIVRRVK